MIILYTRGEYEQYNAKSHMYIKYSDIAYEWSN